MDNDPVDFAMRVPVRLKLKHLANIERINENEPGSKQELYWLSAHGGVGRNPAQDTRPG